MTSYTVGGFAVSSGYTDSSTTPTKTLTIPNLKYVSDFRRTEDEPTEAKIANITGTNILVPETVRFGCSVVKNVYDGTSSTSSAKYPVTTGTQVMFELKETYSANNATTGASYDLPCTGRIVLRFPSNQLVKSDLIQDLLVRTIASAFNTDKSTIDRVVEVTRGALVPSGL